ncbi:MAG: tyrosine-type recombinase/integrase [Acidimicrobiales bacterium]
MSASPNDAAAELALAARAAGVSVEALVTAMVSLPADAAAPTGAPAAAAVAPVTVGAYLATAVEPALTKGKRKVWQPYMRLMTHGYPDLCACMCDACLTAFRGDSSWEPCPCVTAGHCGCTTGDLSAGEVAAASCLDHCAGFADRALASVRVSEWSHQARWAQLRAQKRIAVRNRGRSADGRPTFAFDGRSAVEHYRAALSAIYKLALADQVPGVTHNRALDLAAPQRPAPVARAYTETQLEQLWHAIFTSGGHDPELDMLLVWFCLETGSRRAGPIELTVGDLMFSGQRVRLSEKNNKVDEQPVSPELLAMLFAHALGRGDIVRQNPTGIVPAAITVADVAAGRVTLVTDAPVFYYRNPRKLTRRETAADGSAVICVELDDDGNPRTEPHPLTRKRFESLWARLKRDLSWLDEMHGRPHDLRKTMGTFIERAHGHAVAQRWLRHAITDVTATYTAASDAETTAAHQWLTDTGT